MSDSVIPWMVAHQAPLSMGIPRQYWRELPFPSPVDLPNPGVEPKSTVYPELAGNSLPLGHQGNPGLRDETTKMKFKINTLYEKSRFLKPRARDRGHST